MKLVLISGWNRKGDGRELFYLPFMSWELGTALRSTIVLPGLACWWCEECKGLGWAERDERLAVEVRVCTWFMKSVYVVIVVILNGTGNGTGHQKGWNEDDVHGANSELWNTIYLFIFPVLKFYFYFLSISISVLSKMDYRPIQIMKKCADIGAYR